jgi:hypothetical protein
MYQEAKTMYISDDYSEYDENGIPILDKFGNPISESERNRMIEQQQNFDLWLYCFNKPINELNDHC